MMMIGDVFTWRDPNAAHMISKVVTGGFEVTSTNQPLHG